MIALCLASVLQAASAKMHRVDFACVLPRLVPGRMLNIPTLKRGRARATRKNRARVPPSRVSVLMERQPTWGRVDGRQSGSRALWGCHGAVAGGALTWNVEVELSPRRPAKKDGVCNTG